MDHRSIQIAGFRPAKGRNATLVSEPGFAGYSSVTDDDLGGISLQAVRSGSQRQCGFGLEKSTDWRRSLVGPPSFIGAERSQVGSNSWNVARASATIGDDPSNFNSRWRFSRANVNFKSENSDMNLESKLREGFVSYPKFNNLMMQDRFSCAQGLQRYDQSVPLNQSPGSKNSPLQTGACQVFDSMSKRGCFGSQQQFDPWESNFGPSVRPRSDRCQKSSLGNLYGRMKMTKFSRVELCQIMELFEEIPKDVCFSPRLSGRLISIFGRIRHHDSIDNYIVQFVEVAQIAEEFVAKLGLEIDEELLLLMFVIRLKDEIRYYVQECGPKLVLTAIKLAQFQHEKLQNSKTQKGFDEIQQRGQPTPQFHIQPALPSADMQVFDDISSMTMNRSPSTLLPDAENQEIGAIDAVEVQEDVVAGDVLMSVDGEEDAEAEMFDEMPTKDPSSSIVLATVHHSSGGGLMSFTPKCSTTAIISPKSATGVIKMHQICTQQCFSSVVPLFDKMPIRDAESFHELLTIEVIADLAVTEKLIRNWKKKRKNVLMIMRVMLKGQ